MLIQYFYKLLNRFSSALFVIFLVALQPYNSFAASSILVFGNQEDEMQLTQPNSEQNISTKSDIDLAIRDVSLQDFLPSLSAVTGATFRADDRLNYKIEKFSFSGNPSDLLVKIAESLPVGYYGDGESYDFYSLEAKSSKTYDPAKYDTQKMLTRFKALTLEAKPKLGYNRLANGNLVFEGPRGLFAILEKDANPLAPAQRLSPSLIKGGAKTTE
jgi:hypothetical protein